MILKVDTAGRILLPYQIRKMLGIEPGKEIKIEVVEDKVVISTIEKSS